MQDSSFQAAPLPEHSGKVPWEVGGLKRFSADSEHDVYGGLALLWMMGAQQEYLLPPGESHVSVQK